ncbi:uncharacterized protein A1O5_12030 [Cladophialophora psammophila CBS 110553]|uniref:PPPDE domain-containing protein n=1 Tax=Cladophialophora psammophila CBS 110553 TaxID=1182543 RepID=W9VZW3_9EURO|nr:uncharacterized protein A1O5_12030 [Cladophialophora psammophila CBS 110553]EXJ61238.1 hypothetical protein A1O5_12030 [Cladophialophora psammophila CBS 110553]
MAMMTVYEVQYTRLPAFHAAIYIQRDEAGGLLYHAVGSGVAGFQYEACATKRPQKTRSFYRMWPKGRVAVQDLPRVDLICQEVPVPRVQMVSGVHIQRDCRHWVYEALKDLRAAGVLQEISQKQ